MSNVPNVQHLTLPSLSSNGDHQHDYLHHYLILDECPIAAHSSLGSIEDPSGVSAALQYMMQMYMLKPHQSQAAPCVRQYLTMNSCRVSNLNVFPQRLSGFNTHDTTNELDEVPILFPGR